MITSYNILIFYLYNILIISDDYKTFREAAFFELENLLRSEIKIESKREALDIMYQPHDNEIYGNDDDNFFLYYDDKSGFLFPITLVGSCSSQLNEMSNNNNNSSNGKSNDNKSNNNMYNNNNTNRKKINDNKIDVNDKNFNIYKNNNNNNHNANNSANKFSTHTAVDLFGKVIPSKSHDIFNRKVSANAVLNIQGFDQITKSEVKKRDDDKIKEKEKGLNYQDQLRVHPLATICG